MLVLLVMLVGKSESLPLDFFYIIIYSILLLGVCNNKPLITTFIFIMGIFTAKFMLYVYDATDTFAYILALLSVLALIMSLKYCTSVTSLFYIGLIATFIADIETTAHMPLKEKFSISNILSRLNPLSYFSSNNNRIEVETIPMVQEYFTYDDLRNIVK